MKAHDKKYRRGNQITPITGIQRVKSWKRQIGGIENA